MQTILKFPTWNLCLGLANEREIVTETLNSKNISICCLQEIEVPLCFHEELLNCGGFNLELETNSVKKTTGIYVRRDIKYTRRKDLESPDYRIVIIDVIADVKISIISFNRSLVILPLMG